MTLDVPVPLETYVRPGDQGATLPSVFPAILKPNYGDSSQGITKDAVVNNEKALLDYLERLRVEFPRRPVLVQEFLTGAEYSVSLVGNPDQGLRALPMLEVDFSRLDPKLPKILGYEFEVGAGQPLLDADQVSGGAAARSHPAAADRAFGAAVRAARLPRLRPLRFPRRRQGRDQAARGQPQSRLVLGRQAQPDGELAGMRYSELLGQILAAAEERLGIVAKPQQPTVAHRTAAGGAVGRLRSVIRTDRRSAGGCAPSAFAEAHVWRWKVGWR